MIEGGCGNMQEGSVYKVKVVRLMDYGAFVELPNGFQALLHISELANERVTSSACVLIAKHCVCFQSLCLPSTLMAHLQGSYPSCLQPMSLLYSCPDYAAGEECGGHPGGR